LYRTSAESLHTITISSAHNLSMRQRRFVESETLVRQALTGLQTTLGGNDLTTLEAAGSLARILMLLALLNDQVNGLYEAELLCRRTLASCEAQVGSTDPQTEQYRELNAMVS